MTDESPYGSTGPLLDDTSDTNESSDAGEPSDTGEPSEEDPTAYLEPPDGRVYHGSSPDSTTLEVYTAALGDPSIAPLVQGTHLAIPGSRPDELIGAVEGFFDSVEEGGRVPHLSIAFAIQTGEATDEAIAYTDLYDPYVDAFVAAAADHEGPMFVRIGFEFNGNWNGYTPVTYVDAYRKVVDRFRAAGVEAAFIWCYEPDAPADFAAVDAEGNSLWYPGDDYVDWFGLDVFDASHFTDGGDAPSAGSTAKERADLFLAWAVEKQKPVFLSETAAVPVDLTQDDADGKADWATWFDPFFGWVASHPEIKGWIYMSQDYTGSSNEVMAAWGNARIDTNAYVLEHYQEALLDPRFVHHDEGLVVKVVK